MRTAPPPFPQLSADGRRAVFEGDKKVHLLDTASGIVTTVPLAHDVYSVAVSPHARYIAAAGNHQLTLLDGNAPATQQVTFAISQRLFRLAIGDAGTILGVAASEFAPGTLFIWRQGVLLGGLSATGYSLGRATPFMVALDEARHRFLLWGRQGSQAFGGFGDNYLRLFHFNDSRLERMWNGDTTTLDINGCVFPLVDGNVGIHSKEQLLVLPPEDIDQYLKQPVQTFLSNDLETVVASPDGNYIAWRWSSSQHQREQHHIRVARLKDEQIVDAADFDAMGQFPQLAVDNNGRATLVYSELPKLISVFKVDGGLVKQAQTSLG